MSPVIQRKNCPCCQSAAFEQEQDAVVLATVDAACLANLRAVLCKMPVQAVQECSDRYLVPFALPARELQPNKPSPMIGNMPEQLRDIAT